MKESLVNIIIITYNEFGFIGSCIESVWESNYKNIKFYLVDNNSAEKDYKEFYNKFKNHKDITFLRNPKNTGFAAACNSALALIHDGYVVFLNDDTMVTKNWLSPIIDYMEKHPDVGACQPKIKNMRNKEYFEYAGAAGGFMDVYGFPFCRGRIFFTAEKDTGQYDSVRDLVWCSGTCMVTKMDVLKKVGIFDEIFFIYGEEADLCWRMNHEGFRLVFIPQSTIYHFGSGTMQRQPYRKIFLHHRNGLILLLKNYSTSELLHYIPGRIFFDFLAFWFYIFKSRIPLNAVAVIIAYFHLITLIPQVLISRKKIQEKIKKDKPSYPLYIRSIVLDYYLLRKKKFDQLPNSYI